MVSTWTILPSPASLAATSGKSWRKAGCTEDEINFLLGEGEFAGAGPRRIELNALTSRQLVDLVERQLRGGDAIEVPADLEEQVKAYLEEHPECPWEEAVAEIVKSGETD
jgi:hypothetical protein